MPHHHSFSCHELKKLNIGEFAVKNNRANILGYKYSVLRIGDKHVSSKTVDAGGPHDM